MSKVESGHAAGRPGRIITHDLCCGQLLGVKRGGSAVWPYVSSSGV
jgi:hypothetical protein